MKQCHVSSIPFSSCSPKSSKRRSEPTTRSFTVLDTTVCDLLPAGTRSFVRQLRVEHARLVGKVLRDTSTSDIVDASVAVIARSRAEEVITSDPNDLDPIADALGRPRVVIRSINDL